MSDRSPLTSHDECPPAVGDDAVRDRYSIEELIASGAAGHVYVAYDKTLSRHVAMKAMRRQYAQSMDHRQRFLNEAKRMASLAHPGIPSVHDVGLLEGDLPFFTMTRVRGRSLAEVLEEVRGDELAGRDTEWTLPRLVRILQQVAQTLEYAHGRGVIHRDLKPANLGVGDHGEVYVLDWGLSKRFCDDPYATVERQTINFTETLHGAVKGTPLYMAPEQALGQVGELSPRTDVFALGGLLYETLSLTTPYEPTSLADVVKAARSADIAPPSLRAPERTIPAALEDLALRSLSLDPADRPQTAAAFEVELRHFLEGADRRRHQRERVRVFLSSALRLLDRSREFERGAKACLRSADELRGRIKPYAPPAHKASIWALEDRSARKETDAARSFAHAIELTSRALAYDPADRQARELMAHLYHERYLSALAEGRGTAAQWLKTMVQQYNDGPLDDAVRELGHALVTSSPPGAVVTLIEQRQHLRRWVDGAHVDVGTTPLAMDNVAQGRHIVSVRLPGCMEARVPLLVQPGSQADLDLALVADDLVPEGFVHVPAGTYISGAPGQPEERDESAFLIGVFPVTLDEYALWLDDLHATSPDAVRQHLPTIRSHGDLLEFENGRHRPCPVPRLVGETLHSVENLPVVGVTAASAHQYAKWVGSQLGLRITLPSNSQWEKSARGTDGRLYPWGQHFEPTYCGTAEAPPDQRRLLPVGTYEADVSPYGVRDTAGGVREWCRSNSGHHSAMHPVRGGGWSLGAAASRLDLVSSAEPDRRDQCIGFRLVVHHTVSK